MAERTKFIVANAVNFLVMVNEVMLVNTRKGTAIVIEVPNLYDRAYTLYHESGIIPITDTLADEEQS